MVVLLPRWETQEGKKKAVLGFSYLGWFVRRQTGDKSGAQKESAAGDIALGLTSLELLFQDSGGEDIYQEQLLREGAEELPFKEGTGRPGKAKEGKPMNEGDKEQSEETRRAPLEGTRGSRRRQLLVCLLMLGGLDRRGLRYDVSTKFSTEVVGTGYFSGVGRLGSTL